MSASLVGRTLGRLRHPWLFGIAAAALAVDLVVPDFVPFVDEILLLAATTGLGLLKKRRVDAPAADETGDSEPPPA